MLVGNWIKKYADIVFQLSSFTSLHALDIVLAGEFKSRDHYYIWIVILQFYDRIVQSALSSAFYTISKKTNI